MRRITFNVLLLDTSTMATRIVCAGCWRRQAWVPEDYIIGAKGGDLLAGKLADAGAAAARPSALPYGAFISTAFGGSRRELTDLVALTNAGAQAEPIDALDESAVNEPAVIGHGT